MIRRNLRNPLTVEEFADVANLSPREFSRAFLAETALSRFCAGRTACASMRAQESASSSPYHATPALI